MASIAEHAPRAVLRWNNYWHPADPLAYPCGVLLGDATATDIMLKLNEKSAEVEPLDYIGQQGSREILSPLAYTLTQLWLHANRHIPVETTQLEELREHGSGTRAVLSRTKKKAAEHTKARAQKAAAIAKQKAQAVVEKAQAARENAREKAQQARNGRVPSMLVGAAAPHTSSGGVTSARLPPAAMREADVVAEVSSVPILEEGFGDELGAAGAADREEDHDEDRMEEPHMSAPRTPLVAGRSAPSSGVGGGRGGGDDGGVGAAGTSAPARSLGARARKAVRTIETQSRRAAARVVATMSPTTDATASAPPPTRSGAGTRTLLKSARARLAIRLHRPRPFDGSE
jgi:hypothetical protein